jgi:hypothetical protein
MRGIEYPMLGTIFLCMCRGWDSKKAKLPRSGGVGEYQRTE